MRRCRRTIRHRRPHHRALRRPHRRALRRTSARPGLDTYGGGPALTFTSDDSGTTWTLTGAGSLSAGGGASVRYSPPATVAADVQVKLIASNGGTAATTETITLHAPQLNPTASQIQWYVGDPNIVLTVSPRFTDAAPTWSVSGGGSLSSTQGNSVQYTPPIVTSDADAVVSVSAGGDTESLSIALAPASEKTMQLSEPTVQAGSGNTVTLTLINPPTSGSLTWTTSLGTVTANGNGTATYTPPATLALPAIAAVSASDGTSVPFTATITVTPSATLSVSPPAASTSAATGQPVSLTATSANTSVTPTWAITSGRGSLSATSGSTVSYLPDPGDVQANDTAVVTATLGNVSQSVTITLNFRSTATFNLPVAVAVDDAGNLYVVDQGDPAIRKITPAGVVTTLMRPSSAPTGVAVDGAQNVYVSTSTNGAGGDGLGRVLKIPPGPNPQITTLNAGSCQSLVVTAGVAADSAGNVYVVNQDAGEICKIPAGGAGARFSQSPGLVAVATDLAGNVYVANNATGNVSRSAPGGRTSTVLTGLSGLAGLAVERSGNNIYASDANNNVIRKFPVGVAGKVTVYGGSSGNGTGQSLIDGVGTSARFGIPNGLAIDSAGNVYVADFFNDAIRMISPAGVVTTIAGTGQAGHADGTALPRPAP